jgi:hypothetical protein
MDARKRQIVVFSVGAAVAVGGIWFYFRPKPKAHEELDLPPGTVYYTGPLKGKSGTYGKDTFFPEYGTESPPNGSGKAR